MRAGSSHSRHGDQLSFQVKTRLKSRYYKLPQKSDKLKTRLQNEEIQHWPDEISAGNIVQELIRDLTAGGLATALTPQH
jgi:hypothetical protein